MLNDSHKDKLNLYLQAFLAKGSLLNNGISESPESFGEKRKAAAAQIHQVLSDYLQGTISLKDFKEANEKLCRAFPYWGFKNFSGQMQLNQYVNNIGNPAKEDALKNALRLPENIEAGKSAVDSMSEFLSEEKKHAENPKAIPRVNQSYLLSYFWEIQAIGRYPVYYGSSKKVLVDLGLMNDSYDSYGEEYGVFAQVMDEIIAYYRESNVDLSDIPYWFVEHVLWSSYMDSKPTEAEVEAVEIKSTVTSVAAERSHVASNTWIPPVIADLEDLASNKETEWTKERGVKPEKAFETKLRYAFTILGFDTEELGQGKGRQPDGVAISRGVEDGEFAIVYDAKARENYYGVGTGDREMSEYIRNKKTELKRQRVNRVYFVIVSSEFSSNPNDITLIREVYRTTQVPITLLKASDLLFIIENKLKNSDLNHTYLENLLLDTGIRTRQQIVELLGDKIEL
jgi:hypothetical protein